MPEIGSLVVKPTSCATVNNYIEFYSVLNIKLGRNIRDTKFTGHQLIGIKSEVASTNVFASEKHRLISVLFVF